MTKHFLKNKLNSILSTRDGGLDIPPFGYAQIREVDLENLSILYCLDRGWAEVVNEEPKDGKPVVEEMPIESHDPFKGLTLEELQAEQAEKAEAKAAADAAKEEAPAKTKAKKAA